MWVALLAGAGAGLAPLTGLRTRSTTLLTVSTAAALAATAVLVRALVVGDYSLVYVADFSRRGASAPYRAAGVWGGMAGSLLWLAALVGLAGLVGARRLGDPRRRGHVAAITGATVAVLVLLVIAFADPFATLAVPATDGAGLTPILEHPAMLYHPPLLYLGLATLVGPFALTVSALVDRRLDGDWLAMIRRWALVPWTLLGVGMVAGAHWAYVELGWGGYWAWDPVENTALLPWLAVTVLLHAARGLATSRPPVPPVAVAALACLPFVLALLGSLLTRSGATSSVHAFAEARAIGRALAVVVVVVVVAVVVLVRRAARAGRPPGSRAGTEPTSLPGLPDQDDRQLQPAAGPAVPPSLVTVARLTGAHVAVVGAALAVVLAGTLWPLAADLRGGDGIAVEGSYFAQFTGPLATGALALACLVPPAVGLAGRARRVTRPQGHLLAAAVGATSGLAVLLACAPSVRPDRAVLGAAAGACLVTGSVAGARARRARSALGGHLTHAAFGLLALGIAGTASGGSRMVSLQPGDSATVLGHEVAYAGVTVVDGAVAGSSAGASSVVAEVATGGQRLRPSLVAFPDRGVLLAETSLQSTPAVDVQVSLRTARDDGTALLEVGVHPLQMLVWWGGLAVVAAGGYTTWEASRRRPAVPRRRHELRPAAVERG